MHIIIKKYNETFCRIEADEVVLQAINNYFSFKADKYQFHPKYKAGIWDGKIRLYNLTKNLFPQGLLFKLHAWLKNQNFDIEYVNFDKSNTIATNQQIIKYSTDVLKFPFALRDYQVESIRTALVERKCVILSPTASGKSAIIYVVTRMIQHRNQNEKTLIIVPTISLVSQLAGDFDDYSVNIEPYSKECQLIYGGESKKINKNVTISTWQSLQTLPKEFFMQFTSVIVDECHCGSVDGKQIKKIVEWCSRAKYKIGLSGTIQDSKLHEFSINAIYGKIYQFTNTNREIERGNLSQIQIHQIFFHYDDSDAKLFFQERKQLERDAFLQERDTKASIYHHEIAFINEKNYKRNFICSICRKQKKNTLILFRRNSQFGFKLFDQMKKEFVDRQVFLVTGATEKEQRESVRKICEKHDNAIIISNYQLFSTGINIVNLHNIIFGESTKSKITTLQSIGRGLRKLDSKEMMQLFDIVDVIMQNDNYNIMFKHAFERLEMYEKEKFPVKKYDVLTKDYRSKL
jgi:superfamily II DNA or RNA helicase